MDDAVHEIDIPALEVGPDGCHIAVDRRVCLVTEVDEGLGRDQPEHEPRQDAYRPERAVHHLEDQRVLVVGRAGEHVAFRGDDLVLEAGVVEAAVYEGHGLDGAARHGPADGDCLQLRDDDRHEAQRESLIDQLAERDARLGDADAPLRVDLDDLVEVEQVDLLVGVLLVMNLGDLVGDDPLLPGEGRGAFPAAKLLRRPAPPSRRASR